MCDFFPGMRYIIYLNLSGNELFSTATFKPERILVLVLEELQEPLTNPLSSLLIETIYIDRVGFLCYQLPSSPATLRIFHHSPKSSSIPQNSHNPSIVESIYTPHQPSTGT